ncbi:MAG: hypothetical protein JSW47_10855 [Phycisphaerales bacterium]|nr:MAG: hypothetical protein JSW47_10855 [Phycisphaerales bacterium]
MQTKTEYKSPFSAEELQEIHVGGSDLGLAREHYCAFKGPKRCYRYVESYENVPSLPPAPELPDDATEAQRGEHGPGKRLSKELDAFFSSAILNLPIVVP